MSAIHDHAPVQLSDQAQQAINANHDYLKSKLSEQDTTYYGINTGFGSLCQVKIDHDNLQHLQYNLIVSHSSGTGPEVDDDIVRLMMLLKIQNLSIGYSGVRLSLVEHLIALYNADILPIIYEQGSLGASGDLAPLAHMGLTIIGQGQVRYQGQLMDATEALTQAGLAAYVLGPKEGLALINGTQFSTAYATYCVYHAQRLARTANLALAISLDAFLGDRNPFDRKMHQLRSHQGQILVSDYILETLSDSQLSSYDNEYVQDPYSFRCAPQVHGASMDTFAYAESVIHNEINGVSDNPLLFASTDQIISGGNFHAQPIALILDFMAIALAELGSISERRTYKLLSGERLLPPYLANNPGLESGLMIAQYTAASIVSQNKQLCTPASVDSIISSGGQEDHVSMAANAGTKCYQVVNNIYNVLSIELLAGIQALECRRPSRSSTYIENIIKVYRKKVSRSLNDEVLSVKIKDTNSFIRTIEF
ncbi:UNVERIFIED_CONTAM: hypothetical protein GTU68_034397 [Idotea baltica]|nr:hypothetical protein [Idotea baltica]